MLIGLQQECFLDAMGFFCTVVYRVKAVGIKSNHVAVVVVTWKKLTNQCGISTKTPYERLLPTPTDR